MSDLPPDERLVSPVGGPRRFLKSKKARNALIALVAVGAVGFVVAGINAAINDKSTIEKPIDTGASTIAQVIATPPIPPIVEPKPAEPPATKIVYVPGPSTPPPPPLVVPPTNFVQFPAGLGGEGFSTSPLRWRERTRHLKRKAALTLPPRRRIPPRPRPRWRSSPAPLLAAKRARRSG